jgi:hypothetical protein
MTCRHPKGLVFALIVLSSLLFISTSARAVELFHNGRTGNCEECHAFGETNSEQFGGGQTTGTSHDAMSLRGSDASSTCLRCHEAPASVMQPEGHYVATSQAVLGSGAPIQLTPGGDFGWLKKDYSWRGERGRSSGSRHGHNIVAADFNYKADDSLSVAPGGTYPSRSLSCISCHDPHGNYRRSENGEITTKGLPIIASGSYSTSPMPGMAGSVGTYRMLAGKGYQPRSEHTATIFTADPPAAVAPVVYNRAERNCDTRVAYGSGMSEWCQNCHGRIHIGGNTNASQHPAGNDARLSPAVMNSYNSYVETGDFNGSPVSSYSSMVPYEMGTNDYDLLRATANSDGSNLRGPGANGDSPNVMCLTCHRAHASGWDSMTRWNNGATFLVMNGRYPGIDTGASPEDSQGRTEAEIRKTFYDRPASRFASFQRSLCNKCHALD